MNEAELSKNIFFNELLNKYENNYENLLLNELNFIDDDSNKSIMLLESYFNKLNFDEKINVIEKFSCNFEKLFNDEEFIRNLNIKEFELNQYKILIKNNKIKLELNDRTNILYDVLNQVSDLMRKNDILNEKIRELESFKDMYESYDRHTLKYCKDYVDEHKDF
jgi:exonuclease I